MKFTSLDQLQDGTKVLVQFSTRDNEEGIAPEWSEPQTVTLYVQRQYKAVRPRGRVKDPNGRIVALAVKERLDWAEYSEGDFDSEFSEFLVENYRMKILEVVE